MSFYHILLKITFITPPEALRIPKSEVRICEASERKRNKTRERLPKPERSEDFIRETDFIAKRFHPPKVDIINHNLAPLNYDFVISVIISITRPANDIPTPAISLFEGLFFVNILIMVEIIITPPVTKGYCAEAGIEARAISRR